MASFRSASEEDATTPCQRLHKSPAPSALNSVSGRTSDASGVTVSPLMLHYNEPCVGKAEMNVPISDVVKSEWLWTVATVEVITRQQNR